MDMYEMFALLVTPNVVAVLVLMCMTAYAFILDVEYRWDTAQAEQAQAEQAQAQQAQAEQAQAQAEQTPAIDVVKMVEAEQDKLERLQQVVYQLLGGLYDQRTQKKTLSAMVHYLYNLPEDVTDEDINEISYPTTRQGDHLNERCDRFFKMLKTDSNRIGLLSTELKMHYDLIEKMSESIDTMEKKMREQDKTIADQQKQIETTF